MLCLSLCKSLNRSPPVSSVHGILLARILEWVAVLSSRGFSQCRVWTPSLKFLALVGRLFTTGTTWEAQLSPPSVSPVTQSCPTLCDPMDCSTPGLCVHHQLPEFTHSLPLSWHPLSSPSPPTFNLSQHHGLYKWVSSSHQVAKGLEFRL